MPGMRGRPRRRGVVFRDSTERRRYTRERNRMRKSKHHIEYYGCDELIKHYENSVTEHKPCLTDSQTKSMDSDVVTETVYSSCETFVYQSMSREYLYDARNESIDDNVATNSIDSDLVNVSIAKWNGSVSDRINDKENHYTENREMKISGDNKIDKSEYDTRYDNNNHKIIDMRQTMRGRPRRRGVVFRNTSERRKYTRELRRISKSKHHIMGYYCCDELFQHYDQSVTEHNRCQRDSETKSMDSDVVNNINDWTHETIVSQSMSRQYRCDDDYESIDDSVATNSIDSDLVNTQWNGSIIDDIRDNQTHNRENTEIKISVDNKIDKPDTIIATKTDSMHDEKNKNYENFFCVFCSHTFIDTESASRHYKHHINYYPIQCLTCNKRLTDLQSFVTHHTEAHANLLKGRFKKKDRPEIETWIEMFLLFQARINDTALPAHLSTASCVDCPVCAKLIEANGLVLNQRYPDQLSLSVHLHQHLGYYPYECALCKANGKCVRVVNRDSAAVYHLNEHRLDTTDMNSTQLYERLKEIFPKTLRITEIDELIVYNILRSDRVKRS